MKLDHYNVVGAYNNPITNERIVEVPLANKFLDTCARDGVIGRTTEVGCVTPYYFNTTVHRVVDLTDDHPRAERRDARDMVITQDMPVLAISTVEHMGYDAVEFVNRILVQYPLHLITWPIGHNEMLDRTVKGTYYLERMGPGEDQNIWFVSDRKSPERYVGWNDGYRYMLAVVTNCKEVMP